MRIYKANIMHTPTPDHFEVYQGGYIVVDEAGYVQGIYEVLPLEMVGMPVVDYGDRLLIPAMNDMHVHAPQYANMGVAMDMELIPWLNVYTFPEEEKFADERYAKSVYDAFVMELCRQGTMRAAVFATTHLSATQLLAKIFDEVGMGALIGLVGMDRYSPDKLANTLLSWKADMQELVQSMVNSAKVKPIITPRFIPSCTPAMLQTMGDMAEQYSLPVQSHLSENKREIAWVKELEPQSCCYGDAYHRYGLFGQTPTLMAHCCYTGNEELELMRANNVCVVHCPTSNCNLASGIAPIRKFLQSGVRVALGSDMAAGHHLSIFRVMQYAVQMSKLQYALSDGELPFLTLSEVFFMATKAGGSFFGKVGSFENGYEFDAVVMDDSVLVHPQALNLAERMERAVYLGLDEKNVTAKYVAGRKVI